MLDRHARWTLSITYTTSGTSDTSTTSGTSGTSATSTTSGTYDTSDTSDTSDTYNNVLAYTTSSTTATPGTTFISDDAVNVTSVRAHRNLMLHNNRSLSWTQIRRLARRGGGRPVAGVNYSDNAHLAGNIRSALNRFLAEVVHDSLVRAIRDLRTAITTDDVLEAVRLQDHLITDTAVRLFSRNNYGGAHSG